jgi:hypothetical protein
LKYEGLQHKEETATKPKLGPRYSKKQFRRRGFVAKPERATVTLNNLVFEVPMRRHEFSTRCSQLKSAFVHSDVVAKSNFNKMNNKMERTHCSDA